LTEGAKARGYGENREAIFLEGNMKHLLKVFSLIFLLSIISPLAWAEIDIKEAVVKIYAVNNRYNYYEPWQMRGQRQSSGSGIIITGKRILTNAHVVADHTFIQVKRAGQAKKYVAKAQIVAHECDLAILKVEDDSFFDAVAPLRIGDLAQVRDKVAVYGFPVGGDELAITEGVVSRIEHHYYSHSSAYLLTCQIDAAINPGSSGGAVVKDEKIVGVAFQGGGGENIGYMVPAPVIMHFLNDIKDNEYNGIPGLSISIQEMENPDIRSKYKMTAKQTGVLVNNIYPDSAVSGQLAQKDVILSINNKNIDNDGTIEFRKNERTSLAYIIQNKYINDTVKIKILREGKTLDLKIKLTEPVNFGRLVPYQQYDRAPTYYIIGGLVFEPLTENFLKEWGRNWHNDAPGNLVNYYYHGEPLNDRRQIVVLVKVLADEINVGYHEWRNNVISYVNNRKISTIKDLAAAFEEHQGQYHIIEDEKEYKIILEKEKVDQNSAQILQRYKITNDRSADLKGDNKTGVEK
ncbi:MAG: trypsin-like peptidase domain-containing protein, partial [Candidatus Omnitrophica bacterium]|nr:trypsin-like peptidase domain-containing protein [Candidatus Omnitrophota bacterium]